MYNYYVSLKNKEAFIKRKNANIWLTFLPKDLKPSHFIRELFMINLKIKEYSKILHWLRNLSICYLPGIWCPT
jgi:hypothetical protein